VFDCFFESRLASIAEIERTQCTHSVVELDDCQPDQTMEEMFLTGGNRAASVSKSSLIRGLPVP
jgi:hypothetical protein